MRLETERLILRQWEERDRAPFAMIRADPMVRRFYQSVATREETDAVLDEGIQLTRAGGFHFHAAELKESGVLIGMIGIAPIGDELAAAIPGHPGVEIGWQLDKAVWGHGLAPEGARAWLDYGFGVLGLPEIVAFTAAVNRPSQRVMEKLGMTNDPADDFAHPRLPEGHWLRPHVLYRIKAPQRRP